MMIRGIIVIGELMQFMMTCWDFCDHAEHTI